MLVEKVSYLASFACAALVRYTSVYVCVCVRFFFAGGIYDFQTTSARSLAILIAQLNPTSRLPLPTVRGAASGMCISDRLGSLFSPRPLPAALEVESSEDAIKQPIPGWFT